MSLILNGVLCQTIEELETQMNGLSETQKTLLRNDFNGASNIGIAPNVPFGVTPRQIRLALLGAGISVQTIEDTINSLPEPNRTAAMITWEYSVEFQRSNPLIQSMAPMLGLTSEQIDQLFTIASTL